MTLTRRTILGGLLGAGALALGACTSTPSPTASSSGRTALTLGLTYIPNVQFAPFYVAVDQGLFTARGLDVTVRHHGEQEDIFGALLAGREQVLCASADEAMVAVSTGQEALTFASFYRRYPLCIMAPKEAGARSVADLRGKRIGVPGRYGSSWFALLAALAGAGMTEGDIVVQEIGWTSVSALMTHKVDAVVGYANNEPIQFASQGFEVSVLPVTNDAAPTLIGPSLLTTRTALPVPVLRAVADAVLAAQKAIVADPNVGIEATLKQVPDLSQPTAKANAEQVLAATIALWKGADGQVSSALDMPTFARMSELLKASGITKDAVPPASAVLPLT